MYLESILKYQIHLNLVHHEVGTQENAFCSYIPYCPLVDGPQSHLVGVLLPGPQKT